MTAADLSIGRVGLALNLYDPERHRHRAAPNRDGMVTFSGDIDGDTLEQTKTLRDELAALARTGQVVPVVWDSDPHLDGFYRPRSFNLETLSLADAIEVPAVGLMPANILPVAEAEKPSLGCRRSFQIPIDTQGHSHRCPRARAGRFASRRRGCTSGRGATSC